MPDAHNTDEIEALLMRRHGAALLLEDALVAAGRAYKHLRGLDARIVAALAPHVHDGLRSTLQANAADLDAVARETLRLNGWSSMEAQSPATCALLPLGKYIAGRSDRLRAFIPADAT